MITKGVEELCAEAEAEIETVTAEEAVKLAEDEGVQLVDIRDIRELWREGAVPGAVHAPRGMLEFWIDPESSYHREVFASGKVLQLDNFRSLRGFGWKGFKKMKLWRQDKGQKACAQAFVDAISKGGPSPIPLEEVLEVSRLSIEIAQG